MPHAEVNGIKLHYELAGSGKAPVVMLSNSLGTRLEMWQPQMAALAGRYRVLRYDSRGHGRSDAPPGAYTMAELAADALGVLDWLGIERAHFCGLSMGGMVGQILGASHGARLSSLTLCATTCHMPAPELWDERIRVSADRGMAALVDGVTERWFTAAFRATPRPEVERVRQMILETPAHGYGGCCAAIRDMDLRETVRRVQVPTLVVAGADDPAITVDVMRGLHERIPGSRFVSVPNAAHLLNIEQAETFNRTLLEFLETAGKD